MELPVKKKRKKNDRYSNSKQGFPTLPLVLGDRCPYSSIPEDKRIVDVPNTPENDFQRLKRKKMTNYKFPKVEPAIHNAIPKKAVRGLKFTAFQPKLIQASPEEKEERMELFQCENNSPKGISTFYVCSRKKKEEANNLKTKHEVPDAEIVVCNDIGFFSENVIPTDKCEVMFLLVDTDLLQIVMRKQQLHNAVYDYFSDFGVSSKVFLVNRLPKDKEWYFQGLKYQLPESAVKDYTEIDLEVTGKHPTSPRTDGDLHTDNKPNETTKDAEQPKGNIPPGSSGGAFLQLGDKCAMHITKSKDQKLQLRQDGNSNTINVQIVAQKDATKIVIIATDPTDPTKEKVLKQELEEKAERINLKLKNSGIQIVDITSGSVIIKLEAREAKYVDREMLEKVINVIFGEVGSETMNFKLDIESAITAKAVDFEKIMKIKEEDLHRNCVNKNQYDDVTVQLEDARKEINALKTSHQSKPEQLAGVSHVRHTKCVRDLQNLRRRFSDLKRRSTYHHIGCVPREEYEAKLREIDDLRGMIGNPLGPGIRPMRHNYGESYTNWGEPSRRSSNVPMKRCSSNFKGWTGHPRQMSNPY